MNPNEQELARWRAAFACPAEDVPAPDACPAPDRIWAAVRGELPADEIRGIVEHTAVCAACAEDWRLAVDLGREAGAAEEAKPLAPVVYGRFQRWRPVAAAVAMAAALAIVVGIRTDINRPVEEPVYREAQEVVVRSLVPAGRPLPRRDAVLRWTPVPGAVAYDLLVSTENLKVVTEAEGLRTTAYKVPENSLAGLPPGAKILWRVEAVLSDGSRDGSPTFTTTLQ
jgi:hypothetical protein